MTWRSLKFASADAARTDRSGVGDDDPTVIEPAMKM